MFIWKIERFFKDSSCFTNDKLEQTKVNDILESDFGDEVFAIWNPLNVMYSPYTPIIFDSKLLVFNSLTNMNAMNVTQARANLFQLIADVNFNSEPITSTMIKGKCRSARGRWLECNSIDFVSKVDSGNVWFS